MYIVHKFLTALAHSLSLPVATAHDEIPFPSSVFFSFCLSVFILCFAFYIIATSMLQLQLLLLLLFINAAVVVVVTVVVVAASAICEIACRSAICSCHRQLGLNLPQFACCKFGQLCA